MTIPIHTLYYNFEHIIFPRAVLAEPERLKAVLRAKDADQRLKSLWRKVAADLGISSEPIDLQVEPVDWGRKDLEIFLVTFPEPKEVPDAYYAAVVYQIKNQQSAIDSIEIPKIFTLEKSILDNMFCGWGMGDKHINFGPMKDNSKLNFIEKILERS